MNLQPKYNTMKSKIVILICSLFLASFCYANMQYEVSHSKSIPHGNEEIVLIGQLDITHRPDDIEAYTDQNNVYVLFHRDFGYVSITLYAESGATVYSDVVNTDVQQIVIIPFTGVPDGIYTLGLENAFGNSEGGFNKGS